MMAFLVFSDWYNPGDVAVHKHDGTVIPGVVLQETRDEIVIQVDRSVAGLEVGEKITFAKTEIARLEEAQSTVMTIFQIPFGTLSIFLYYVFIRRF